MDQNSPYGHHATTHYHHYHHLTHSYAHYGGHYGGGGIGHTIMMWMAHSIVSFAVWHTLGPLFRHLGIVGSIIGGVILVVLVAIIWKIVRRFTN